MKKLAFLFLIYDEINQEELWHNFFRKIDKTRYSVYIHYKYNKPLEYFEAYKIDETVPTDYADLSLVKAQNVLLREALKDAKNERFIFLSNSCIPLKDFDYIYNALFAKDLCFFNMAKDEHIFESGRGQKLAERFGQENVRKASQWSILTREIAQYLAESDDLLESLYESGKRGLADEYFYISYIFYLNKQHCIHEFHYEVANCTTFEYWNDREYISDGEFTSDHPLGWERRLKTFHDISGRELLFLFNAPCLFGRKFSSDCTVDGKSSLLERVTELFVRHTKTGLVIWGQNIARKIYHFITFHKI